MDIAGVILKIVDLTVLIKDSYHNSVFFRACVFGFFSAFIFLGYHPKKDFVFWWPWKLIKEIKRVWKYRWTWRGRTRKESAVLYIRKVFRINKKGASYG